MTLRPADVKDEALFYEWREWAERRGVQGGWYEGALTDRAQHAVWYADRLERVRLLVWEWNRHDAGVVRIDSNGEVSALAAPDILPILLRELHPYAFDYGGRLKMTIDQADDEFATAVEQADFRESRVRFYAYRP